MKKMACVCAGLMTVFVLGLPAFAFAQDEPDAGHWGAQFEGLPGQPAHGEAFQHMPDYQPGSLDTSLPGQPGHAPPVRPPAGYQLPPDFVPAPPLTTAPVLEPSIPSSVPPPPVQPRVLPSAPPLVTSDNVQVFPVESAAGIHPQPPPSTMIAQDNLMKPVGPSAFQRDTPARPDKSLNPQLNLNPPPSTPASPHMNLGTRAGFDIGAQDYYDRYMEPDDPTVVEGGNMGAITAAATVTFGHGYFSTIDARYGFGGVDYQGSGTFNGSTNKTWEGRWVIGKDLIAAHDNDFPAFPDFGISPYIGVGYRNLYNDLRGVTSTGAHGYRRENQLFYLPLGVKPRFSIDENSRLTSTFETDVLLFGRQKSYLSDDGFGDPNLNNRQKFGIGLRADIMYETEWWSIGPFINFWEIDKSETSVYHSPLSTCGGTTCVGWEPQNYTIEAGIQMKIHFLTPLLNWSDD